MSIIEIVKKVWWVLLDRCEYCGGVLNIWDYKKSWCTRCGKENG